MTSAKQTLRPTGQPVALEWRGRGRSATPDDGDYSFPAMAEDVDEAVNRLGIGRILPVAHSGGGLVAVQYAAEHPERVAGLLLADPGTEAFARGGLDPPDTAFTRSFRHSPSRGSAGNAPWSSG